MNKIKKMMKMMKMMRKNITQGVLSVVQVLKQMFDQVFMQGIIQKINRTEQIDKRTGVTRVMTRGMSLNVQKGTLGLLMVSLFVFNACTKNEIEQPIREANGIGFGSYVDVAKTRAEDLLNSDFLKFRTSAYFEVEGESMATKAGTIYMSNVDVYRISSTSSWQTMNDYYWPLNDDIKLNFFAYSPNSASSSGESYPSYVEPTAISMPKLTYTAPNDDNSKQSDVVVSLISGINYASAQAISGSSDKLVKFDFKHILTRIQFSFKGENSSIGSMPLRYEVHKVELEGVKPEGEFIFDATHSNGLGEWRASGAPSTYTYYQAQGSTPVSHVGSGAKYITGSEGVLMLIPQTTSTITVKVYYRVYNGSVLMADYRTIPRTVNLSKAWSEGDNIVYTLSLPVTGKKILFDTEHLDSWDASQNENLEVD